jgi:hypothetical protein
MNLVNSIFSFNMSKNVYLLICYIYYYIYQGNVMNMGIEPHTSPCRPKLARIALPLGKFINIVKNCTYFFNKIY